MFVSLPVAHTDFTNTTNTQERDDTIYILKLVTTFNILEANLQHFLPTPPMSHSRMIAESGTCNPALPLLNLQNQQAHPTKVSFSPHIYPCSENSLETAC